MPPHSFLPKNVKIKTLLKLFCDEENQRKLKDLEIIKMFLDESPKNLSGGELRMIEILLIIFSKAEIILLDEPFANLSPKLVSQIKTHISELNLIRDLLFQITIIKIFSTIQTEIFFW